VPDHGVTLFVREIGAGQPVIVVHGGPDFDHCYLRPELDRLARSCRLVYYDQRGRGRSGAGVRPDEVSIGSEVADLDALRASLGLDSVAVLGHSWGGVLAMEYATRHPERVSHLILMNSAPASASDWVELRRALRAMRPPGDLERMRRIAASTAFQGGDLSAEAEFYRLHFRPTVRDPEQLERIVARLRAHFTAVGVLVARAIEDRLYGQTCERADYDLIPALRALPMPALVLHGGHDLIPVELAARIAAAIPRSNFVVLGECGHFAYLEAPDQVSAHVARLLAVPPGSPARMRPHRSKT
jgi:proline iminopeptidase